VPVPRVGLWQRFRRGISRLRQRPDWPLFAGADWPERIMDLDVTDRFHAKQGRSTGRLILPGAGAANRAGNLVVYLKRHYHLPWWQGLMAILWPSGNWSPALQEWEHLEWARRQGVPVPNVVAAAEFIGPGCKLRSILAVEELTNMLPLNEAIPLALDALPPHDFAVWKHGLVAELARLARLLHDRHVFHKDLYLCHFYVDRGDLTSVPPDWRGRVNLIDLHRLTYHPWSWRIWQLKDLAQLLYSSDVPGVDARDRLLFWREYRGPGPNRPALPLLRWFILFKWRRYKRHNARRAVEPAA
jgi:heptose I phosphotransferase